MEERRLRLSGSSVHDPDTPLLAIVHVAEERQRVRQRIWRGLRAEERRRLQTRAADLDPAKRRLLRDFGRPADHYVASAVQPAVRRAERLAPRAGRLPDKGLRDGGV